MRVAPALFFGKRGGHIRVGALVLAIALVAGNAFGQDELRVVTTSADLESLVKAVGGERVEVESLTEPDQDPHTFEAKPAQLARVRAAGLVVRIGLDHEPWFARLKLAREAAVLDASKNVRLIQTQTPRLRAERHAHVHAYGNTHYWLDPENVRAITADIRDALAKLSPQDATTFEANRTAFLAQLERRFREWQAALAPYREARLIVVHDSWAYFAHAFDLKIVAAAEPRPGVPPSPAELAALIARTREAGVRILLAEPSSNPALVRAISERTGAQAVILRPSGHDYVRLLDENVASLAAALRRTAR